MTLEPDPQRVAAIYQWLQKKHIRWPTYGCGINWSSDRLRAPVIRGPAISDAERLEWPGCRVVVSHGATAEYAWLLECIDSGPDYSLWRVAYGPDRPCNPPQAGIMQPAPHDSSREGQTP